MTDLLVNEVGKDDKIIQYKVKFSFNITYILLLTTATIILIEALRTKNTNVRNFYSAFVAKISDSYDKNKKIDWGDINKTRYIDWFITTPLMLLALCLVLSSEIGSTVKLHIIFSIVLLNYLMLYIGYLGETNVLNKGISTIMGFIFFGLMYFIIFYNFVLPKYKLSNYVLFTLYLVVWSVYGIVYLLDEENKNLVFNVLDLISKCFVGLGLWAYYTKVIVL